MNRLLEKVILAMVGALALVGVGWTATRLIYREGRNHEREIVQESLAEEYRKRANENRELNAKIVKEWNSR